MIRYVPQEGVNGYNLTSHDVKPTKNIKTGSMVFETDTQNRYFFNEETSEWIKYTGPILDFYTPIARDVFCFFGLSTDEKPTKLDNYFNIGLGSIFVEIDKSKAYIYDEDGWKEAKDPSPTPQPVLQDKTINPTINAQQVTYDSGYDGLGTVSITAVTNNIDANIKAENIKKDIAILGVTGTYEPATPSLQDKTVTPATIAQTVQPDEIYDGLHTVTVNAVTSSIDNNIQAANIKKDVTILGITGTYEPVIPTPSLQDKTVAPKTTEQVVHADEAYDGLNTVTVSAVTNSIDSNIQAANIKKDVTILGITGSYEPATPVLQDKTVTPTTAEQVIHADAAYDGLDTVTVSAVTSSIDNKIQAANIKKNVTILGVVGTYEGEESDPVPTPEEWAEEIAEAISLIAALPSPEEITADDREQILEAEAAVSTFLAHYTSKITNYSKLLACIEALDEADVEPEEPIHIVCTFTNNSGTAVPSDPNIYVYHTSIKSGTFVIDDVTYANTTAKLDSSAIINFHQDAPLIVRLHVAPTKPAAQTIRIDGTEIGLPAADGATVSEAGIIEINNLATGCHTISKGNAEVVIGKIELLSVNA